MDLYGDLLKEDEVSPKDSWKSSSAKFVPSNLRRPVASSQPPVKKPKVSNGAGTVVVQSSSVVISGDPHHGERYAGSHKVMTPSKKEESDVLMLAEGLEDPYDPMRPNDYEEYCRARSERRRQEELEIERQVEMDRMMEAEERAKRDRELMGRSEEPAPAPTQKKLTAAERMMQKMGWSKGQGLGKQQQGITTALTTKKTGSGSGVIINRGARRAHGPSTVVLLRNMVGPGEVDATLQDEVGEECLDKYGPVEACTIHEVLRADIPPHEAVRIFVKFSNVDSARKALNDLNNRYFGGREVRATFFDEKRFISGALAPNAEDLDTMREEAAAAGLVM
eukprot:Rmarinus@m.19585